MTTSNTIAASDFEQRMLQLDAMAEPQACEGETLPWTAADLAHIEQKLDQLDEEYRGSLMEDAKAVWAHWESTMTFTFRETCLRLFRLISEDEQWAMMNARVEQATEELGRLDRKKAKLEAQEKLWETRLQKLRLVLGQNTEAAVA